MRPLTCYYVFCSSKFEGIERERVGVGALFGIRDAQEEDLPTLNAYNYQEGMDALPSADNIRVATNEAGEIVGYLRLAFSPEGVAHVNPIVTYPTWRGYGVGRALMDEALQRHGELRFVARGASVGFYKKLGYQVIPWDEVCLDVTEDCRGCSLVEECGPVPMGKRLEAH